MAKGYCKTDYLVLQRTLLASRLDCLTEAITDSGIKFDAITYRGHSGALVAPTVAYLLEKELILVRSTTQGCHTDCLVEGYKCDNLRYIILDDLTETGRTINIILRRIEQFAGKDSDPRCVGAFFYKCYSSRQELREPHDKFSWDFPLIVANTQHPKRIG